MPINNENFEIWAGACGLDVLNKDRVSGNPYLDPFVYWAYEAWKYALVCQSSENNKKQQSVCNGGN